MTEQNCKYDKHWNKFGLVTCPDCGKTRWARTSPKRNNCYPCNECNHIRTQFVPKNEDQFKDQIHDGYVFVRCKEHPRAYRSGFVKRCVLIMEAKLGRPLEQTEHIHHLNGIRDDDRPENLIVLTNSEHAKLHAKTRVNIKNRYQMGYSAGQSA